MATIVSPTVEIAVQPAPPGLLQARQAAAGRVEAYLCALGVHDRSIATEQAARIVEHTEAKYPNASPAQLGRHAFREAMRLREDLGATFVKPISSVSSQPPVPERAPLTMPEQRIGRVPWAFRAVSRILHPLRSFLRPQLPPAAA